MKTIRCAVIGGGYIGKFHAEKFTLIPHAELAAIADIHPERAQKLAENLGGPISVFTDYHDLVGKVDAVSIAVPTQKHFEVAKFCLSQGIHVLVEKPITTTVAEAEELIELAQQNKLVLQVGHLERFNAVHAVLKEVLQTPLFIESHRLAPYTPRGADVNVVLDLMIHDIDLIQAMVNSPVLSVDACGAPVLSEGIDIANARIKFENGCTANLTASRASLKTERKIKLFQHDAYISIDFHNRSVVVHRKGTEEMFPGIPEITREEHHFDASDAIKAEIEAFIHSIRTGEPPLVSGEDGKLALATAMKITHILHEQLDYVKKKHPLHFLGA